MDKSGAAATDGIGYTRSSPSFAPIEITDPRPAGHLFFAIKRRRVAWQQPAQHNLPAPGDSLLPRGNYVVVPAPEPQIPIYGGRRVVLAPPTGVGVGFHSEYIFEPGRPQDVNVLRPF
jgi:hypothetical protein